VSGDRAEAGPSTADSDMRVLGSAGSAVPARAHQSGVPPTAVTDRAGYQLNGPRRKSVTRSTGLDEPEGPKSATTPSIWSTGASDTVV
jgi:hypothetical protein